MIANELRIGNGIYLPTQGSKFEQRVRWVNSDDINGFDLSECDPIPLTEELLRNCGFEKKHYGGNVDFERWWHKNLTSIGTFRKPFNEQCLYDDKTRTVQIKYLHQLQNLYFALTGEELSFEL